MTRGVVPETEISPGKKAWQEGKGIVVGGRGARKGGGDIADGEDTRRGEEQRSRARMRRNRRRLIN